MATMAVVAAGLPAPVALPGGGSLVLRDVSPADVDGLEALYGGLPEQDLYHRFFQARVPPRHSIERMTTAASRGDVVLVAEVVAPDGSRSLVGEAACALIPDGDGELGLTVAPSHRGWLGPFLLAVLCDQAAAHGVPNIEADILLENRPMLALAAARGYATMDHSDGPAMVRVVFNTVGRVPTWPGDRTRPRVVVETPGARWRAEAAARAAGLQVLVCPGPGSRWCRCPALAGWPCPLASAADLVVDAVDPEGSDAGRRLLEAHRAVHRGVGLLMDGPAARGGGEPDAVVGELHRRLPAAGRQAGADAVR